MSIDGRWTGIIIYGPGYGADTGKALFFDLHIMQNAAKIHGEAVDIGGFGVSPDSATIKGSFTGTAVRFIKQYVSLHYYDKNGTYLDRSARGGKILYTGEYDTADDSFAGTWAYRPRYGRFSILSFLSFQKPAVSFSGTGTWSMRRK